ncbi:hypothetical protein LY15_001771 [Prauserella flava]|uniref:Secreted protein n=2 Tax=Prauserella salsuginis group TaxID=2893672 RepID=A0ABW6G2J4_9PSEU|nr:hypothetical protein [Prauserella sediminis]MBB3662105.1 putative ribosome-associated RNA-binding protein Tma20 [Prauserella sediminis]MCR3719797.1 hypothetical protein [Prauserella flava]MCR3736660.1 hypothetical protein [Prauserella salsuginis]
MVWTTRAVWGAQAGLVTGAMVMRCGVGGGVDGCGVDEGRWVVVLVEKRRRPTGPW